VLVTQLIKTQAQQEGCMQAYTIGLSINKGLKLDSTSAITVNINAVSQQ